ncbi:hypothetical protein Pcinc_002987 [Petrolisthes cinctipes]|uniref:Uncharacterized protein n=1 Tax=Petrolisthes cinctipes TaxID=88211 RepID=A0AAE1L1R0_PETCI|nr:hypothetical protein Pcinc_002987 [Petrolisthes cinctipes]
MNIADRKGLKRPREEQDRLRQTEEGQDNTLAILEGDWLSHDHIHVDPTSVTMLEDDVLAEEHHELLASQRETINEDFALSKEPGQANTIDTQDKHGEELVMEVEKDLEERVEHEQLPEIHTTIPEVPVTPRDKTATETPTRPTEPSALLKKRKDQRSSQSADETMLPAAPPSTTIGLSDESQIQLEPSVGREVQARHRRRLSRLRIDQEQQIPTFVMRAQFATAFTTQRVQV